MSFADVSSGNVVGYSNLKLNAGGKSMLGPCFIKVGTTEDVKLSELKVTGYENSEHWTWDDYAFSGLVIQRRSSNGMPYAEYAYTDEWDEENWYNPHWINTDTGATITPENDVTFKAGDGLWTQAPELYDCEGYYFVSSGEVLKGAQSFELNQGGKIGVCNMLPVTTKLSQVEIHGYEDSEHWTWDDYAFSGLVAQSLASSGMPKAEYAFTDEWDETSWYNPHWINTDSGETITTEKDRGFVHNCGSV